MTYTVVVYKQPPVLSSTLTVEGADTEDAFRAAYRLIDAGAVDWQPIRDEEPTWCAQAVPVEPPLAGGMDDGSNCRNQH